MCHIDVGNVKGNKSYRYWINSFLGFKAKL